MDYPDRPQIFAEQYGYDADSNRTSKHDVRNGVSYAGNSWSFGYDGLDRLNLATRGDWDGSGLAVAGAVDQSWTLDVLGNWESFDDFGEVQSRSHDMANQITQIDGTPALPFTYDDAGNTTKYPAGTDAEYQLVYDAWNRLVQVAIVEDLGGTPDTTPILEQEFNGLHWRTVVRRDTDLPVDGIDQMRVLSYDASWRLIEEQVDDGWTPPSGAFVVDRTLEQFWGLRYIDDPILRRTDPEAVGGYWHVTDVQFSTMALLDNNAAVYERVWYTPYGEARHHWGQDYDGDRGFSTADGDALVAYLLLHGSSTPINDADYVVEMDYNRDGAVTFDDYPSGSGQTAVALGQISDLDATSGPDNWFGYAGYVWEGASGQYQVRHRNYVPGLGRWLQRDPVGYVDGMGLYEYGRGRVVSRSDPFGLETCCSDEQQAACDRAAKILPAYLENCPNLAQQIDWSTMGLTPVFVQGANGSKAIVGLLPDSLGTLSGKSSLISGASATFFESVAEHDARRRTGRIGYGIATEMRGNPSMLRQVGSGLGKCSLALSVAAILSDLDQARSSYLEGNIGSTRVHLLSAGSATLSFPTGALLAHSLTKAGWTRGAAVGGTGVILIGGGIAIMIAADHADATYEAVHEAQMAFADNEVNGTCASLGNMLFQAVKECNGSGDGDS